ncbi:MAG: hypothetical protein WED33_02230 [Bacteroidia bacterium]
MKQYLRIQLLMAISLLLIPLSGFSQKSSQQSENPAPFPRLISSGNPEADKINYEKAVQAWKDQERQRIERIQNQPGSTDLSNKVVQKEKSGVTTPASQSSFNKNVREITIVDLPGYPKYLVTGDPVQDEKLYQLAKAKWMDENPVLYKKYIQDHSGDSGKKSERRKSESSN